MDYLSELKSALYDPLAESWSDAYTVQRALRDRYPAADGVLNFVPYLGLATNVDDIIQHSRNDQYNQLPGDVGGMALNVGSILAAKRGLSSLFSVLPQERRTRATALSFGVPSAAYVDNYIQQQKQANQTYSGVDGIDLIRQRLGNKYD